MIITRQTAAPIAVYVGPDKASSFHSFTDAVVDGLDLAAAGFERVQPKKTGRLGYVPADFLNLAFTTKDRLVDVKPN